MKYVRLVGVVNADAAKDIFKIMYPTGNSAGNDKTMRAALKRTIEAIGDKSHQILPLPQIGYSGMYEQGNHIMMWNYAYGWIAVYKKIRELVSV